MNKYLIKDIMLCVYTTKIIQVRPLYHKLLNKFFVVENSLTSLAPFNSISTGIN